MGIFDVMDEKLTEKDIEEYRHECPVGKYVTTYNTYKWNKRGANISYKLLPKQWVQHWDKEEIEYLYTMPLEYMDFEVIESPAQKIVYQTKRIKRICGGLIYILKKKGVDKHYIFNSFSQQWKYEKYDTSKEINEKTYWVEISSKIEFDVFMSDFMKIMDNMFAIYKSW